MTRHCCYPKYKPNRTIQSHDTRNQKKSKIVARQVDAFSMKPMVSFGGNVERVITVKQRSSSSYTILPPSMTTSTPSPRPSPQHQIALSLIMFTVVNIFFLNFFLKKKNSIISNYSRRCAVPLALLRVGWKARPRQNPYCYPKPFNSFESHKVQLRRREGELTPTL